MARHRLGVLAWLALSASAVFLPLDVRAQLVTRFPGEERYSEMGGAGEVVSADFDRDGWPDLAAAQDSGVTIWLNDRTGKLLLHDRVELAAAGLALADFDEDGITDLALTIPAGPTTRGQIAVLRGLPGSHFGAPTLNPAGFIPNQIQALDVDRDGRLDLAVVNSDMVSTYLGRGDGTFGPRLDSGLPWGGWVMTRYMTLADFDGDTRIDAIVTEEGPNGVQVLRGRGDGTFWAPVGIAEPYRIAPFASGDFDGDGDVDIVSSSYDHSTLLWSDGSGAFVERDALWFQPGHSSGYPFAPLAITEPAGRGHYLAMAAFKGSSYGYAWVSTLHDIADRRFLQGPIHLLPSTTYGLDTAVLRCAVDLDRDGFADFVMHRAPAWDESRGYLSVLRHAAGQLYRGFTLFSTTADVSDLHAIRTAPTGKTALMASTPAGVQRIDLGPDLTPRMSLVIPEPLSTSAQAHLLATADLDRDGFGDLVCGRDNEVSVELALADGGFKRATSWSGYGFVGVGEFDGKRGLDLALSDAQHRIWLACNDGNGQFARPIETITIEGEWNPWGFHGAIGVGDLNADGIDELVTAYRVYDPRVDSVVVYSLRHSLVKLRFACHGHEYGGSPSEIAVADLDNDGRQDVALLHPGAASINVLRNAGDFVFDAVYQFQVSHEYPSNMIVADLDLDGRRDIVTRAYPDGGRGMVQTLYNEGGMTFVLETHPFRPIVSSLVVADLDGDQRPDMAAGIQLDWDGRHHLGIRLNVGESPPVTIPVFVAGPELAVRGTALAIRGVGPNPTTGAAVLRLSVPDASPVRVELFDIGGRRVHEQMLTPSAPGDVSARLEAPRGLPTGIYLVRVGQRQHSTTTRLAVLR